MHQKNVLGIDIGATKVCIALVSNEGEILRTDRYLISEEKDIRGRLFQKVDQLVNGEPIAGIGIGVKGLISSDLKTILSSSVLRPVLPWDICSELEERYGVSCFIDNDVHAATCAEMMFGAGKQTKHFAYVNLGTGLAMGIVENGCLLRGGANLSGEIGCFLCSDQEDRYYELETVASGGGLVKEARRLAPLYPQSSLAAQKEFTGADIAHAFALQDELAVKTMQNAADAMALALYNLMLLLDPDQIVFGGGVMANGVMLEMIQKRFDSLFLHAHRGRKPVLSLSALGCDHAGVLGAASVWMNHKDRI